MAKFVISTFLVLMLLSVFLPHRKAHPEGLTQRPEVVKIGLVAPLSGSGKWIGQRILKGVQHALGPRLNELQADVRLAVEDSRGDPARAASSVRKLGEDQQVVAIIGPAFSESVVEAAPSATLMRIPTISPTAAAPGTAALSPYLFRNSMTVELEVNQLADYAMHRLGLASFSILYPLNTRGLQMRDDFLKQVQERGGQIIYSFSYHPRDTDFGEILKRMGGVMDEDLEVPRNAGQPETEDTYDHALSLEYQAIFVPGSAASASLIAPALYYYNMTGVRLLGTSQWNSKKLLSWGGRYVEGLVFVDGFFAGSPWPHVADFVKSFKRAFGQEPDVVSAQAYDAASIILDLIQSGIREREAIREALLRLEGYPGVSGYTTFLPSGESRKELFVLTVEDGKVVQLN